MVEMKLIRYTRCGHTSKSVVKKALFSSHMKITGRKCEFTLTFISRNELLGT